MKVFDIYILFKLRVIQFWIIIKNVKFQLFGLQSGGPNRFVIEASTPLIPIVHRPTCCN